MKTLMEIMNEYTRLLKLHEKETDLIKGSVLYGKLLALDWVIRGDKK